MTLRSRQPEIKIRIQSNFAHIRKGQEASRDLPQSFGPCMKFTHLSQTVVRGLPSGFSGAKSMSATRCLPLKLFHTKRNRLPDSSFVHLFLFTVRLHTIGLHRFDNNIPQPLPFWKVLPRKSFPQRRKFLRRSFDSETSPSSKGEHNIAASSVP